MKRIHLKLCQWIYELKQKPCSFFFRLALRVYEVMNPHSNTLDNFRRCYSVGRYHIPVIFFILIHIHHLMVVVNSSINFVSSQKRVVCLCLHFFLPCLVVSGCLLLCCQGVSSSGSSVLQSLSPSLSYPDPCSNTPKIFVHKIHTVYTPSLFWC